MTPAEAIKVNPADHAVRLTTTLNLLRKAGACRERYEHLLRSLGGVTFDHDAPINLLTILEHNGVDDCLWALRATAENCDTVAGLMAADFAEVVLPIFERERPDDARPRLAIAATRAHALGQIGAAARAAAGDAARDAAGDAAGDAARDAAGAAAGDAAGAAVWAAARAAAGAAVWAAARAAAGAAARAAARDAAGAAVWAAARAAVWAAARAAARAAQAEIVRGYLL